MDERAFLFSKSKPIPAWDLRHRLPIRLAVGPECKDTATIFRSNSIYMDVTEQPYMYRQILALAILSTVIGAAGLLRLAIYLAFWKKAGINDGYISAYAIIFGCFGVFAYMSFRFGRDEFFSLKRRPIRFNRAEQKIFAIRRRRFFAAPGEGDVTCEVPWNDQSIFCMHKSDNSMTEAYHIRHYSVDSKGNVTHAFAIGRHWEGAENVPGLLSQWNYFCEYMNRGPENLPQPPLFFSESEDKCESFLLCMYGLGVEASVQYRLIMMPVILFLTALRLLALSTCRDPVWPEWVEAVSYVPPDDPFDEPRGNTPVGWADTALARDCDRWPFDPKRDTTDWHGEKDPEINAALWTEDTSPMYSATPRQSV